MLTTPIARAECDQTDGAEEFVHRIEDDAHHLRLFDGVPAFERVFIAKVEAVIRAMIRRASSWARACSSATRG